MLLSNATWTQVESYLNRKDSIIIPIGSTEQHGPTGIIGTDYVTAQKIAEEVANQLNIYCAPPLCYGMAQHHLAFPGSAALKPSTMVLVINEIIESFYQQGFKKIIFINGHGGNIAPTTTAFCEFKSKHNDAQLYLHNWWNMPSILEYEKENFGDQSGYHATIGEVSVTMLLEPKAFEKIDKLNFKITEPEKSHWPMTAQEFRKYYPDGRMMSNPGLSTIEHGQIIFDLAVNELSKRIKEIK